MSKAEQGKGWPKGATWEPKWPNRPDGANKFVFVLNIIPTI